MRCRLWLLYSLIGPKQFHELLIGFGIVVVFMRVLLIFIGRLLLLCLHLPMDLLLYLGRILLDQVSSFLKILYLALQSRLRTAILLVQMCLSLRTYTRLAARCLYT